MAYAWIHPIMAFSTNSTEARENLERSGTVERNEEARCSNEIEGEEDAHFSSTMAATILSPGSPPHARVRRTRPRLPACEFCGRPIAETALVAIWGKSVEVRQKALR
jgi:hypothetical protein